MASKIRLNDEVIVIAGKDKKKTGKVVKVLTAEHKVVISLRDTSSQTQLMVSKVVLLLKKHLSMYLMLRFIILLLRRQIALVSDLRILRKLDSLSLIMNLLNNWSLQWRNCMIFIYNK